MASSITSAGAASGIDFESIISATLESKRASLESVTTTKKENANLELSGVGKLKSALETFQKSLQAFTEDNAFNQRAVTIDQPSDTTYFTVEAEDDASNMSYDIAVKQLASTEKISTSLNITDDNNKFEAGTLTFSLGKEEDGKDISFTVNVQEGDSIEQIRRRINDNDLGITANLVQGKDGYTLTIDSGKSGEENNNLTISVSGQSGSGAQSLDFFNYQGGLTTDGEQDGWKHTAAKDAIITVDGNEVHSESNVFDTQISGITLTAKKVTAADEKDADGNTVYNTYNMSISEDYDAVTKKMQEFVSAYNTLMSTMDDLYKHNTYTDGENNYDGGDLAGDSMLRSLKSQLQNFVTSFGFTGEGTNRTSIYNMGVEFNSDGTLELDATTFKEQLSDNFNLVVNAFSGEDGMLSKLDTMIEDYTKSGGLLAQREDELNQTIADVEARETENEAYLEQYEESLRQKYANLDTMISGYNTSLSYLSSVL